MMVVDASSPDALRGLAHCPGSELLGACQTYVAAGSAAVVIILALLGITGMRYSDPMSASRAACLLLGYQVHVLAQISLR